MFAIQQDWNEYNRDATSLEAIQTLLQKDAEGKHVVPLGEAAFASVWTTLNRRLAEQPETLAALRAAQNAEAPAQLFVAKRSGDADRLMTVYRTYPWADAVHQSQLETAEKMLREGQPQLALRHFQDVFERSGDDSLRARAQAGRWMAAAHLAESPPAIEALFRDVDREARFPWFGQQLSAAEIEAKLIAGMNPQSSYPPLDGLSVRTLQLPDDPPWMGLLSRSSPASHEFLYRHKVWPIVSSRGTVVAGPCLVAWYADDSLDAPAWSKIATMDIAFGGNGVNPPRPPFDPLVAEGRIYVRCGADLAPAGQKRTRIIQMKHEAPINFGFLEKLAAFDRQSGQKIWSIDDDPAWADLFPVNAPIYHDGRLYLLAMLTKAVKPGGGQFLQESKAPIFLAIADAATGRLLHRRELVAFPTVFRPLQSNADNSLPPRTFRRHNLSADAEQRGGDAHNELNQYGDRLAVKDGAVYTSTAMGAAARCDARDGLIEWIVTYPQLSTNSSGILVPSGWPHQWDAAYIIARRHGSPPLVGDKVVVFSPRDTVAVFAVDRETGTPLWQRTELQDEPAVPDSAAIAAGPADAELQEGSLEALGLFGDAVLVTFDRRIAALDAATGKVRWIKELSAAVERPIKVVDTTLYVATATDLMQIDGTTGEIEATRALAPLRSDNGFAFDSRGLMIVKPGKRGITFYTDGEVSDEPLK